jgi:hypothetical protein
MPTTVSVSDLHFDKSGYFTDRCSGSDCNYNNSCSIYEKKVTKTYLKLYESGKQGHQGLELQQICK